MAQGSSIWHKLKGRPFGWYLTIPVMLVRLLQHKQRLQHEASRSSEVATPQISTPADIAQLPLKTFTDSDLQEMNKIRWWHRILVGKNSAGEPVITPGYVNHGPYGGDWPTTRFGLSADLSGKTVLDIGCMNGFFSFEAERRGAKSVLAADCQPEEGYWDGTKGLNFAHKALDSKVAYQEFDLTKPDPKLGAFDIVLCYGVLYHLPRYEQAIANLRILTKPGGECLVETASVPQNLGALWAYRPSFDNDPSNFWYPTFEGLAACLKIAGFAKVEIVSELQNRLTVRAS